MIQKKILIVAVTIVSLVMGISVSIFFINNTSNTSSIIIMPIRLNAPPYVCLDGQSASECAQLRLTCGNGVTDPGESCKNCGFDAGCPSGLICGNISGGDDYTCHYPAGLCIVGPAG